MKKKIIIMLVIIFLVGVLEGSALYYLKNNDKSNKQTEIEEEKKDNKTDLEEKYEIKVKESIELKLGDRSPKLVSFLDKEIEGKLTIFYNEDEYNSEILEEVGEYKIKIVIEDKEYESLIKVIDNENPVLKLKEVTIKTGEKYTINSFIDTCTDNSKKDCKLFFTDEKMSSYTEAGTYDIEIVAKDDSDNTSSLKTKLIIKAKETTNSSNSNSSNKNDSNSSYSSNNNNTSNNNSSSNNTSSNNSSSKNEETKSKVTYKYGVKVTTTGSKITYDFSTFNAKTSDMLAEAKEQLTKEKANMDMILKETNKYREELGLDPLVLDTTLSVAASVRSIEMAWGDELSHTRPDGSSCFDILDEFNLDYFVFTMGENIAWGQKNGTSAATWWRNSPGHYANMTNPNFGRIGIGVYKFQGRYFYTQIFTN